MEETAKVASGAADGDWSTGLLDCCGGDGFGKAGDSAGATVCKEVGLHPENCMQSMCGCCAYSYLLYYIRHVSKKSPKPLCGALLVPAVQGCGITQYDCAFGQNIVLVSLCSCIMCPYFRCKLREDFQIKGNIVFDALACWCCTVLAQFQEFREAAIRDGQFSTLTSGGHFGTEDDNQLPKTICMEGDSSRLADALPLDSHLVLATTPL